MRLRGHILGAWTPLLIGLGTGFLLPVLVPTVFVLLPIHAIIVAGVVMPLVFPVIGVVLIVFGIVTWRGRGASASETATAIAAIAGGIAVLGISAYVASRLLG